MPLSRNVFFGRTRAVREPHALKGDELWELLASPWPRFVWRVRALLKRKPVFEVFFDATDIKHGDYVFQFVEYNNTLCAVLLPAIEAVH